MDLDVEYDIDRGARLHRVVYSCKEDSPLVDEIARAFDRFQKDAAASGVVVFPLGAKISRELVEPVAAGLGRCPALMDLVLVHPSPLLGFITSSINLQSQTGRVRSARTVEETTES